MKQPWIAVKKPGNSGSGIRFGPGENYSDARNLPYRAGTVEELIGRIRRMNGNGPSEIKTFGLGSRHGEIQNAVREFNALKMNPEKPFR